MTELEIINTKVKLYSLRTYLLSILDDDRLTEDKRKEYISLCDKLQDFSNLANYLEAEIKRLNDINLELCKTNFDFLKKVNTLAQKNKRLHDGLI